MMANKNDAKPAVLQYLQQQNRPYSANDITQNLHKEFGKTAIQKALDELSANQQIKEKVYGKQKVYAPQQEDEESDGGQNLQELETKVSETTAELVKAEQELKTLETELKVLSSQMSTEDARKELEQLEKEVNQLESKVESLSRNTVVVSSKEKENLSKEKEKITSEYRKRKRICMDIANAILESYPKTKKMFFEEVGLETDEEVKFQLVP